jgi:siroheme synthase-like protein
MKANAVGLAITLDVEGARVVVVGTGEEAERKIELLREAGAEVHRPVTFTAAELDGARMVMVAERDVLLAAEVYAAARARGVLCWACDDPESSDLAMPAVARSGRARIAISTGGNSPALASRIRAALDTALGPRFARFVDALGELRDRVRKDEADPARRRLALVQAVEGFALELTVRYPEWFKDG